MPNPPLSELWRGHTPTTDEPGAFRLLRSISVSNASWSEIDLRSVDYAGATDGLDQDGDGPARGILRAVSILNNEGTGSNDVMVSFYVSGASPTPVTAFNTALADGPAIELRCSARQGVTKFYLKSTAGSPTVQLELWYDVPPAK